MGVQVLIFKQADACDIVAGGRLSWLATISTVILTIQLLLVSFCLFMIDDIISCLYCKIFVMSQKKGGGWVVVSINPRWNGRSKEGS